MNPLAFIGAWLAAGVLVGLWDGRRGAWRHTWVVTAIFGPLALPVVRAWAVNLPAVPEPMLRPPDRRRVVVGVDGSFGALRAVNRTASDMDPAAAEIVLAAVVDLEAAAWHLREPTLLDPGEPLELAAAHTALDAAVQVARAAGHEPRCILLGGRPAHALARFAQRNRAETVVLGPHRPRLTSLLFGACRPQDLRSAGATMVILDVAARPYRMGSAP